MALRLYTYPHNYRVWKTLIAAQYNEIKIETPEFKFDEDNKKPEFLARFPAGKVPALDTPSGPLSESGAILKYVARLRADTGLFGSSVYESAQVEQWIDWSAFELEPARGAWILPVWGVIDPNPKIAAEAKRDVQKALVLLDAHLATETYLVGNQITLADIVVSTAFVDLLKEVLVVQATIKYDNVNRWLDTLFNQPQFKAVLGDVKQTTTEAKPKPVEKKEGEKKESKENKGGEKKEKKSDGKKEAKKEASKKEATAPVTAVAAAPAKVEEKKQPEDLSHLMGDDDDKPAAPKAKNPLDLLPKSPMILDAVKKLMFNKKPYNPDFFNTMWNGSDEVTKFDPTGYSVYTCDYKYNDEHKVYFLTCNLIGGFLQRVERLRKYGFGVVNLLGESDETPPWRLCGLWIFRGQEIPAEMKECDDSEHFNFEKLDITTPAAKALVEEAFVADKVYGQTVQERRYFK